MRILQIKKFSIVIILIILMFCSLLNFSYASTDNMNVIKIAKNFVDTISSKHEHFSDWKISVICEPVPLYKENGKIRAYLFHLRKSKETVGYFILDIKTLNVVEFARGESPYQSTLKRFKIEKFKDKKIEKEMLVYAGPSYYILGVKTSKDKNIFNS
ncbi:hypothetical protein SAMN02745135_02425 [Caloranaerobacter azorensis DSM 13643]|uniref:Uncharacterized protein n=1 Tax=Caloranaerobacter azorensis DSM 13643 TaxID=1121264 RepID=A0A1M5WEA0_9FIRM|nr:hypothetical protein [Caloranaerobacter azorensis]SHH85544.1 hypothetical protein SAMN02745135_02425 [Caloranaerobacter azorensis DSM 13643]